MGTNSVIEEFYSFTAAAFDSILLDIDGASFDTVLTVFDGNGNKLASNDDADFIDAGSTTRLDSPP